MVFKKCCITTRTKKNQNTFVFWFFFFGAKEDLNKAAAHSAVSKATVRLCLARGSQCVGMSTGRTTVKIENPNLFSIGEGFGFFVFFGKQNESLTSIEKSPRPYHKKARQTTIRVP